MLNKQNFMKRLNKRSNWTAEEELQDDKTITLKVENTKMVEQDCNAEEVKKMNKSLIKRFSFPTHQKI